MSMAPSGKGGDATLSVHVLKYPDTLPGTKQEDPISR